MPNSTLSYILRMNLYRHFKYCLQLLIPKICPGSDHDCQTNSTRHGPSPARHLIARHNSTGSCPAPGTFYAPGISSGSVPSQRPVISTATYTSTAQQEHSPCKENAPGCPAGPADLLAKLTMSASLHQVSLGPWPIKLW